MAPGIIKESDSARARSEMPFTNGFHHGQSDSEDNPHSTRRAPSSYLQASATDQVYDILCVGFGPASLAIAVALHDAAEAEAKGEAKHNINAPHSKKPWRHSELKVAFLERQHDFAWHAGMLLPGAKMQISFIKDLATLRNPRSEFTFLNYLHEKRRLVQFTNLGTFLPQRLEYEDYMRWCARKFEHLASYGEEVIEVSSSSEIDAEGCGGDKISFFNVVSRNIKSGSMTSRRAKNVIIAVGGKPHIPPSFPQDHPRIIHSSQFANIIPRLLSQRTGSYKIAVVGAGQSAAEIFDYLMSEYPNSETKLIIRGSALRPSDDSPFVNEIFNPECVDDIYYQSAETREASIARDRGTNYSVVRLELLEKIYEHLYTQRLCASNESSKQKNEILSRREISHVVDSPELSGGVRLFVRNLKDESSSTITGQKRNDILDVDVVLLASGYRRDAHQDLLRPLQDAIITEAGSGSGPKVERDYRVRFKDGLVADGTGIWLQGCNESTHGLSDTLLSILATRAGDVVRSIVGQIPEE